MVTFSFPCSGQGVGLGWLHCSQPASPLAAKYWRCYSSRVFQHRYFGWVLIEFPGFPGWDGSLFAGFPQGFPPGTDPQGHNLTMLPALWPECGSTRGTTKNWEDPSRFLIPRPSGSLGVWPGAVSTRDVFSRRIWILLSRLGKQASKQASKRP